MIRTKYPVPQKRHKQRGVSTPFRWDEKFLDEIRRWGSLCHTRRDIAQALGVCIQTIDYWLRTKPKFREVFKEAEKESIENVKRSFYELATGYSHPDSVILTNRVTEYDDQGKPVKSYNVPLVVPIIKHYPPNALAALKFLTIKDRENWMDIQKIEKDINVNLANQIDLSDFTDTELLALEKIGMKRLAENASPSSN